MERAITGHPDNGLMGLVLAGGRSRRMNTDKASLTYFGRPQTERAFELLKSRCLQCYLSNRADQADAPGHSGLPQIHDSIEGTGPMIGIISALLTEPLLPWLVLACDLPYLDGGTIDHLIYHRNPARIATAFASAHDGLPEPLCAIYEPRSLPLLRGFLDRGLRCPRKALMQSDIELLEPIDPLALENVNYPEEYKKVKEALEGGSTRRIRIEYFAALREERGCQEETLETRARTAAELYDELLARHAFSLPASLLRVAINDELSSWKNLLASGDTVAFLPPSGGG